MEYPLMKEKSIVTYIAGLSAGVRQASITVELPQILAMSWQLGAMFEIED